MFLSSFCGDKGRLCLLQLSSKDQTMLIDIHKFKLDLQWTDAQFESLFELMFGHGKTIYGKIYCRNCLNCNF